MSSKKRMPKCIGHYDVGDEVCDGDPKGETEEDRMVCVFRDRCAALKQHCLSKGFEPQQFIKIRKIEDDDGVRRGYAFAKGDDEQFADQLSKWSKRWGVKAGRVTKKTPDDSKPPRKKRQKKRPRDVADRPGPDAAVRKKARAATAEKAKESLGQAYELSAWFTKCLEDHTGRKVVSRQGEAETGDLFVVDRLEKSRYAAVYCRSKSGSKLAVASIYPHTRSSTCQVRFPVQTDVFDDINEGDKLEISAISDGKFRARSKKLDKEGVALAAEVIARLVKSGTIDLPVE